ncbi:flagellar biosynthesis anti-sigma factor FlgM [Pokkaliibacter sp. CJK22405]|uniref:flagellar biosynthesis anti-sigma factor FlgM n=1 Tax=Pokkaliibacter sp. CJK22405 TaxID=3384615 RepID=UPI0039855C03
MPIDINGLGINQPASSSRVKTQTTEQQKTSDTGTTAASGDKVQLSSEAMSLQSLEDQVHQLSDFDQDKVDRVKAAIADGSYSVDANSTARKMLDFDALMS